MNFLKQILNKAAASIQKRKTEKEKRKKAENDAILEEYRAKLSAYQSSLAAIAADRHCFNGEMKCRTRQYKGDEGAIAEFSRALELDPNCVTAYIGRGFAYIKIDQLDLARNDIETGLKLYPGTWDQLYDEKMFSRWMRYEDSFRIRSEMIRWNIVFK